MVQVKENANPCLSCGACCAYFRVSFYWGECDDAAENGVPVSLTEKVNGHRVAMKGTNGPLPRCAALEGDIGKKVSCTIYDRRPSPCRSLPYSWQDGASEDKCDKSRLAWGMKPLEKKSNIE